MAPPCSEPESAVTADLGIQVLGAKATGGGGKRTVPAQGSIVDYVTLEATKPGKIVVLGLVTTKVGDMESKETLKRRIAEAAEYVPLEQLCLSPQCGFSSTVHGNNIAVEAQRTKLRLIAEVAQEVWG